MLRRSILLLLCACATIVRAQGNTPIMLRFNPPAGKLYRLEFAATQHATGTSNGMNMKLERRVHLVVSKKCFEPTPDTLYQVNSTFDAIAYEESVEALGSRSVRKFDTRNPSHDSGYGIAALVRQIGGLVGARYRTLLGPDAEFLVSEEDSVLAGHDSTMIIGNFDNRLLTIVFPRNPVAVGDSWTVADKKLHYLLEAADATTAEVLFELTSDTTVGDRNRTKITGTYTIERSTGWTLRADLHLTMETRASASDPSGRQTMETDIALTTAPE